jgi:hypothetical protein
MVALNGLIPLARPLVNLGISSDENLAIAHYLEIKRPLAG